MKKKTKSIKSAKEEGMQSLFALPNQTFFF
jgi:hypothetical protein